MPQYIFRTTPASHLSKIGIDAFYTQNRQYNLQLTLKYWLPDNRYRVIGKTIYKEWPTTFYGIGSETPSENRIGFTERQFRFSAVMQHQVRPGWFAGLVYTFRWATIKDVEKKGLLTSRTVVGSGSGTAAGVGVVLSWDTRNQGCR